LQERAGSCAPKLTHAVPLAFTESACLIPEAGATRGSEINEATLAQMTTAPEFRLPPDGGYMDTARDMARLANERGQCLVIDGPLASRQGRAERHPQSL